MGASNALLAYQRYAGAVPATSLQVLVYMALISIDADAAPWFGMGSEALARFALGRTTWTRADEAAVERALSPLHKIGAITTERPAARRRRDAPSTARYRLHLGPTDSVTPPQRPTESVGREPVTPPQRPTESVGREPNAPRNPCPTPHEIRVNAPRNPWSTPHGIRGTEEYEEKEERKEEKGSSSVRPLLERAHARERQPMIISQRSGTAGCARPLYPVTPSPYDPPAEDLAVVEQRARRGRAAVNAAIAAARSRGVVYETLVGAAVHGTYDGDGSTADDGGSDEQGVAGGQHAGVAGDPGRGAGPRPGPRVEVPSP